jgi:Secretion system C-terminal sorting domain
MVRFSFTVVFLFLLIVPAFSQLIVAPILKDPSQIKVARKFSRTASDTIISRALPFFDDFSGTHSEFYPDPALWLYGNSVTWSDGIGINPPSLGVVSFEGLDSLGRPYDVTNIQAKGFQDQLVSWPIKLDSLPVSQTDSLYLSFFYQFQGNGDAPEPGDRLYVEFKNDQDKWLPIETIENASQTMKSDTFYTTIIHITDPQFHHHNFQFRIRSFGRLSGPWDTWNVDYVYLNTHRFATDLSFPDRTIYSPLTSLFGNYWAVPIRHFYANPSTVLSKPSFSITNLRQDQGSFNGQPVNYTSRARIEAWKDTTLLSVTQVKLDSAQGIFPDLQANQRRQVSLNKIPSISSFEPSSDSIRITLFAGINSGDNIIDRVAPRDSGDYTPKYIPIDFRLNDSTRGVYTASSYYAYDDGTAESGAGLNQPGGEVAYYFKMATTAPDTLVAVDLYFPNFGDQSNQNIQLTIRSDTAGLPLYQEIIPVERSALNKFRRHVLYANTIVHNGFYIGWRQTSSAFIAVGLDASHDTGDKVFFNVNGFWEQNTTVVGSLMMRPIFGKGSLVTGLLESDVSLDVFPNPTTGTFYLSAKPDAVKIFDYTGRAVEFVEDYVDEQHTKIELTNPTPGIYLVKSFVHGKTIVRKIMVQR